MKPKIMGKTMLEFNGCPAFVILKNHSCNLWIRFGFSQRGLLCLLAIVTWFHFSIWFKYFGFNFLSKVNYSYMEPLLNFSKGHVISLHM
jgi:DNA modification methylase